MNLLIIDEVSMVSPNLIDAIDWSLRRNTGLRKIPFGGKQVLFVGDIFQLKPVVTDKDKMKLDEIYENKYNFFNAEVFKTFNLFTIYLKKVYRQSDLDFINILDRVKVNRLEKYDLAKLNERVVNPRELSQIEYAITLTTTNKMSNDANNEYLSKIDEEEFKYRASISRIYPSDIYPTNFILNLKVGAQIMFVSNDKDKKWVNGTVGMIDELTKNSINVRLQDGSVHEVKKVTWQNYNYTFDYKKFTYKPKSIGSFKQFPLVLGYSMTINKSQGATIQKVIIDFGKWVFSEGLVYVALSRSTSLTNIYLKRPIWSKDIFVDPKIIDFVSPIDNDISYKRLMELSKLGSKRWYKNILG